MDRTTTRRIRARVHGRNNLELLEDVDLPADGEVMVAIELPAIDAEALARAIDESAGVWTDDNHPGMGSREEIVQGVINMRTAFQRSYGG